MTNRGPSNSKPIAVGGSKDTHVSPKRREIKFAVPIASIVEDDGASLPAGAVRVFDPDPPHKWQFSVTQECARKMLSDGKARLMRSSKRVRGICPIFVEQDLAKGFPVHKGTPRTYMMKLLPAWIWRETYYVVINSCRTHPLKPWTWDEIIDASAQLKVDRRRLQREMRRIGMLATPAPRGGRTLCPPLKQAS